MFNNKFTKKDPIVDVISQIISERWDDDDEDDDVKRADAELRRMKAKPIEADKKTDPDKEIGKLAKKTPKEVDEAVEKKADKDYDKDGKIESGKDEFWGSRLRAAKMKNEDKWTDIADGPWKKSKKSSSQAMSSAHNLAGKGMKDAKSLGRKPDLKAAASYLKSKIKEESEQIDEISTKTAVNYMLKVGDRHKSGKENIKKREPGFKLALDKVYGGPRASVRTTKEETNLQEEYADMSHAAKELVLHADNHPHLHYSSHTPIMNNLKKKMKNGTYDSGKAKKLWAYHADRAAQSYAKEHGDGRPWHKMFSTSDRKQAASHWEDMHKHELHESVNEAKGPTSDYGLETFATNVIQGKEKNVKKGLFIRKDIARIRTVLNEKGGSNE